MAYDNYSERLALQEIKRIADCYYAKYGGGYTLSKDSEDEEIRGYSYLTQALMTSIRTQTKIGLDTRFL